MCECVFMSFIITTLITYSQEPTENTLLNEWKSLLPFSLSLKLLLSTASFPLYLFVSHCLALSCLCLHRNVYYLEIESFFFASAHCTCSKTKKKKHSIHMYICNASISHKAVYKCGRSEIFGEDP